MSETVTNMSNNDEAHAWHSFGSQDKSYFVSDGVLHIRNKTIGV